jgi:hypothetical protein
MSAITWIMAITDPLNHCHLDRTPKELATEEEWRDPEDAYPTMPLQGVSTRIVSL